MRKRGNDGNDSNCGKHALAALGALALAACAMAAPAPAAAAAAPQYTVTVYQPAPSDGRPLDINDSGHIAGMFLKPGGPWADDGIPAAFVSSPTRFTDISAVMPTFHVVGLNNSGQVAGYGTIGAGFEPRALVYANGVVRELGTLGGSMSTARAINDAGHVVGYSTIGNGEERAFLYRDGAMRGLEAPGGQGGISAATDINNLGHVVGEYVDDRFHTRAFLYRDGVMSDIGTLGGSYASASDISDAGHVLGVSRSADGIDRTFIYHDGVMRALPVDARGIQATGINSNGDVVGSVPSGTRPSGVYLWSDGELVDIATRITGAWELAAATAINDAGQIAALACTSRAGCLPAVLSPVPEPAAASMMLAGLGVLGALAAAARRHGGRDA